MKKPFKDNSNLNVMKKIFLAVMALFLMTSCWDKVYDEGADIMTISATEVPTNIGIVFIQFPLE